MINTIYFTGYNKTFSKIENNDRKCSAQAPLTYRIYTVNYLHLTKTYIALTGQ